MAIPHGDAMRLPILRMIEDGDVHEIRDVIRTVADELGVGEDEQALLTPKTARRKFDIAVTRCVTDLRKAALLKNTVLGEFRITDEGRAALSRDPEKIDLQFLRRISTPFRKWEEYKHRGSSKPAQDASPDDDMESDGMVAIIDVLGVKGSWKGGHGRDVHRKWKRLLRRSRDLLQEDKALGDLNTMAFSDTLFVTAEGKRYDDLLFAFSRASWPVVVHSIREDIPVRGCVACGRFLRHAKNLVTGPAVDEAAMYHCLPQWVGISAAPSANGVLTRAIPNSCHPDNGLYAMHDIPLKSSVEQDAWAVNWPGQCDEADDDGGDAIEDIVGIIDDRANATPDIEAAFKWRNTRRFCNSVLGAPNRQDPARSSG